MLFNGDTTVITKENELDYAKDANTSVLASGKWGKVRIAGDGIYKVSYDYLLAQGLIGGLVPSNQVGVFGTGSGMLPYPTALPRPEDLHENPIQMEDGGDGQFGPGDYFLFYAFGPDKLLFDDNRIEHVRNTFDRFSYYFLTSEKATGKRLASISTENEVPDIEVDVHHYYAVYENDFVNIGKSGRQLFGENFDFQTSRSFTLYAPGSAPGETAYLKIKGAGASDLGGSKMKATVAGQVNERSLGTTGAYTFGNPYEFDFNLSDLSAGNIAINLDFTKANSSSNAWLDFISVEVKSQENLGAGSTYNLAPIGDTSTWVAYSKFINPAASYWVLGDFGAQYKVSPTSNGSASSLLLKGGNFLRVAEVSGSNFSAPTWVGLVSNQNLHALEGVDYIIIHPDIFSGPAANLANFHRTRGLNVETVSVNQIYNEFSSGARHVIGIRDFLRYVYKKDPQRLKYALLLGDGSYWNLDGKEGNTNFLPTYQSNSSLNDLSSFITDDFFGFLGDNEGAEENQGFSGLVDIRSSDMDIAIGRFPVSSVSQANAVVDKIKRYMTGSAKDRFGAWRNILTFISDDLDGNGNFPETTHTVDANRLATWIEDNYKAYQTTKIFPDAYKQVATPGGSRYPAVNKLIRERVQEGALIVNYTGHGGEVGWAHERILDLATINGWTNRYAMPVMVTATCEFSRFDDFERASAGELCLLNPNGGVVSLLSTTRVVYSTPNFEINLDFVENLFKKENGKHLRLGDIYLNTKRQYVASTGPGINHLNFSLLGDPALEIAFPENEVVTTRINGQDFNSYTDTIKALSLVELEGEIQDGVGSKLADFNGVVDIKIYDKASTLQTLDNDGTGFNVKFKVRNSLIYQGKATVSNGGFKVKFIVPKDIQFQEGSGLIQYYANSDETDANGGTDEIIVGGTSSNPLADDVGPDIDLFLNNLDFLSGDVTGENPNLIAFISDESGINITGSGIGHDMMAYIDGDVSNAVTLNSFYRSDLDSYQSGSLEYPFENISSGNHRLTLRAWDNNNNPSEASIDFLVRLSDEPFVEELLAYPNPAVNNTNIEFEHNQGGYATEAILEIIDMSGKTVASKTWNLDPQEKGVANFNWDLKNREGATIKAGTYVYRVTLNSESGKVARASNKLLVVR
ncbi:MAG: type IX secretion system sortase PorU [Luteibaculum sp.]